VRAQVGSLLASQSGTGQIEINQEQAAIVRQIYEWRAAGWSGKTIAQELNVRKVPAPAFLDRAAASIRYERAILYGSRARGDYRVDSDADLALIMREHADEWPILSALSGLAFDVFLETGVLIQPVPISSEDWAHPDQFPRPSFLRNVAREGIDL